MGSEPTYELIDLLNVGENVLLCSCGERIYPDCDISGASISQEFDRHVQEAHPTAYAECP